MPPSPLQLSSTKLDLNKLLLTFIFQIDVVVSPKCKLIYWKQMTYEKAINISNSVSNNSKQNFTDVVALTVNISNVFFSS